MFGLNQWEKIGTNEQKHGRKRIFTPSMGSNQLEQC